MKERIGDKEYVISNCLTDDKRNESFIYLDNNQRSTFNEIFVNIFGKSIEKFKDNLNLRLYNKFFRDDINIQLSNVSVDMEYHPDTAVLVIVGYHSKRLGLDKVILEIFSKPLV